MADGNDRASGVPTAAPTMLASIAAAGIAPLVGKIVAIDDAGIRVAIADGAPVTARSIVALDTPTMAAAIASGRGVLLVFEAGDPTRPIILGLLTEPGDSSVAHVDGQKVVIEGKNEVELRCGAASITLRRNGRVIIRGIEVETRARGVNRIRGGSVMIN